MLSFSGQLRLSFATFQRNDKQPNHINNEYAMLYAAIIVSASVSVSVRTCVRTIYFTIYRLHFLLLLFFLMQRQLTFFAFKQLRRQV
jgi:hypothetical protein